jgi:hypothetical protein
MIVGQIAIDIRNDTAAIETAFRPERLVSALAQECESCGRQQHVFGRCGRLRKPLPSTDSPRDGNEREYFPDRDGCVFSNVLQRDQALPRPYCQQLPDRQCQERINMAAATSLSRELRNRVKACDNDTYGIGTAYVTRVPRTLERPMCVISVNQNGFEPVEGEYHVRLSARREPSVSRK